MEARWRLASLWESVTAGEEEEEGGEAAAEAEEEEEDGGRFLREPFCLTTPPFWLGLFALWTTCDLCCALDAASLAVSSWSPSAGGQSPLEAAVRGSWPLLTGVLVFEGAFPLALRGWCPPLLRARGSPLASLRAMVLSQWAWQGHCHSACFVSPGALRLLSPVGNSNTRRFVNHRGKKKKTKLLGF